MWFGGQPSCNGTTHIFMNCTTSTRPTVSSLWIPVLHYSKRKNVKKSCTSFRRVSDMVSPQLVFRSSNGKEASARQARRRATNYACWCAIVPLEKTNTVACYQLRMLMQHWAVPQDQQVRVQQITDAAIVPSKKTSRVACNELRMLRRHRAQWIADADMPSCHQKRQLRWRDLCRQMRHRAVNKDGRADVQRITDADAPSCRQKRQTRWRVKRQTRSCATNYRCWGAIVCNEWKMLVCHHVRVKGFQA
jgi:hypothetical protein